MFQGFVKQSFDDLMFWGRGKKEITTAAVREREGIVLPESDEPFTEEEKRKAQAVLAIFRERYGTPEKPN
ncbi:MAG: hypothetical protein L6Q56_05205 [Elstera cyanobacteriorum]|uniref:hypothetical protein n=2 Tax=Elstera cyanobacteriorum TaxID=2022747 RepID=UPI0023F200B0|nr:hypothetical protein [Elstera cyanobacteriorum]MCK6442109.1 hypothetical protein [Elstera cyanobacteriorum]